MTIIEISLSLIAISFIVAAYKIYKMHIQAKYYYQIGFMQGYRQYKADEKTKKEIIQ